MGRLLPSCSSIQHIVQLEGDKINKLLKVNTQYTKRLLETWKTSLQSKNMQEQFHLLIFQYLIIKINSVFLMINQRWLYTKQAIQRYLQGIIFLCKKTLSFS